MTVVPRPAVSVGRSSGTQLVLEDAPGLIVRMVRRSVAGPLPRHSWNRERGASGGQSPSIVTPCSAFSILGRLTFSQEILPTQWPTHLHAASVIRQATVGKSFRALINASRRANSWDRRFENHPTQLPTHERTHITQIESCDSSMLVKRLVGASGFEPPTSWSRTRQPQLTL